MWLEFNIIHIIKNKKGWKNYEKACEAGNAVKAAQVLEDMEKKYPEDTDWTEDQMERIIEASATLAEKQTEDALKALESLGGLEL